MSKKLSLTLLTVTCALLLSSFQNFAIADQAPQAARRVYKFEPVRSEDWPETAETNEDEQDSASSGRAPSGDSAMPKLRTLPDGSIDPDSFKDFTSFGGD